MSHPTRSIIHITKESYPQVLTMTSFSASCGSELESTNPSNQQPLPLTKLASSFGDKPTLLNYIHPKIIHKLSSTKYLAPHIGQMPSHLFLKIPARHEAQFENRG